MIPRIRSIPIGRITGPASSTASATARASRATRSISSTVTRARPSTATTRAHGQTQVQSPLSRSGSTGRARRFGTGANSAGPEAGSVGSGSGIAGSSRGFATATETPSSSSTNSPHSPIILPSSPLMSNPFLPIPPIPTPPAGTGSDLVKLKLPPTDDREHRYFVLDNGIEVIVVSDPKADKAAAGMDVGVGHLSDPADLPGCAHFCEHLLFMGTKTFPSENEYSQYLSAHNGHSNAWTAMTSTVYFFDVSADALEGALDRFSGFFYEPLFNEDCTEREIKAVDSENKKNLQQDMWRFFQLEKHVFREDHAYHKFGTGNYKTLWEAPRAAGRDPRRQLIEWWEKWYCARRMKLSIVGKESTEVLEKWAREKFAKVPIRSQEAPAVGEEGVRVVFDSSPMGEKQMGMVTFARPVKDNRGLEITFPFPDLTHLFQSKPTNYVTHFLGHEGKGSVLSYLKKKGWSNYLRAGMAHGVAGFDFFKVTVDLSPEGLQHWKDVALAIFKYISLLRAQPPDQVAFDEIKTMADISFRFSEKHKPDSYCVELTGGMQDPVPREKIISAKYLLEEYRPDEIANTLIYLDPRKAAIGVTSRELPKDVQGSFDQTEPIYGTEYHQTRVTDDFIKEAIHGQVPEELRLPDPNPFIPKKLDVVKSEVEKPASRPELLLDTPLSRLWYKRDDTFWIPKTNFEIRLVSPILNITPRNQVLTTLLTELFSDSITEDVYDAEMAELRFGLYGAGEYIGVSSKGFTDKMDVLVERMLTKLVDLKIDEDRFREIVDQLTLMWENFKLSEPYRLAMFWDQYATTEVAWTQAERLEELKHITSADVQAFAKELFQRMYIEALIHGNIDPEGAAKLQNTIETILKPRALTEAERAGSRSLIVPPGSSYIHSTPHPNPAEVNNAVVYHLYLGDVTDFALRAALQLFEQIANEPAFDQLRTKEQLGYIVQTSVTMRTGELGWKVLIQSERDPVHVESRIENFIGSMTGLLDKMTEEEFAKNRQSLISKREEKAKNLGEETRKYWNRVTDQYYEFGRPQREIEWLRKTTKADVIQLLNDRILPGAPHRAKLSTHIKSQYTGVKFDPASAQPLMMAFMQHGVVVDQAALGQLMATGPDLDKVKAFAKAAVDGAANLAAEGKQALYGMVDALKGIEVKAGANGDGEGKADEENRYIEDVVAFKAGLKASGVPRPLEAIGDKARL